MTTRLYYEHAGAQSFDAIVQSCDMVGDKAHVILNQTAFYPTSGGQPFDTGTLGAASVLDVFEADGGEIIHVATAPLDVGDTVRGVIDWQRRIDHMQQHTGQHLLSAAFDRTAGVRTTSFHLGTDLSTVDLAREVTPQEATAAEAEANRVVWDDRPVTIRFVTADEASRLPLRKEPVRAGTLRLVEVEDFDLSACGGTHVARTGTVGVIAISAVDRFKGGSRVSFVCGGRALRSHAVLRDVVLGATRALSVTPSELKPAIERIQQDARDSTRTIRRLQDELAGYRAAELRAGGETIGPYLVVLKDALDVDAGSLKPLAVAVATGAGIVSVIVGRGTPLPIVIACSNGVEVSASALIAELSAEFGGRGGGTATLAQGGMPATPERVKEFVRQRLARGV